MLTAQVPAFTARRAARDGCAGGGRQDDVRVLQDGEAVSVAGTHLGHNLPDRKGNRYCINLVSVAAYPAAA